MKYKHHKSAALESSSLKLKLHPQVSPGKHCVMVVKASQEPNSYRCGKGITRPVPIEKPGSLVHPEVDRQRAGILSEEYCRPANLWAEVLDVQPVVLGLDAKLLQGVTLLQTCRHISIISVCSQHLQSINVCHTSSTHLS
ncbi:hypothetical protein E2C01_007612 [Portunus trituberculatus]|uniref:Uncharacterized protein n=1 Tax=Portunus trituberculatus TaxID=210409 RepID=A0A5B7CYK1_PORTR|nr:hypothetical protein [Portunus trituberculatus]